MATLIAIGPPRQSRLVITADSLSPEPDRRGTVLTQRELIQVGRDRLRSSRP